LEEKSEEDEFTDSRDSNSPIMLEFDKIEIKTEKLADHIYILCHLGEGEK